MLALTWIFPTGKGLFLGFEATQPKLTEDVTL
jgi:hypothetical protein